jgi:flagellar protein FliS
MNHTASSYQKVQVETTDSLKLVVMLYEGAINFLEQARLRVAENQVAEKGILINKVVAIVSELQSSLNMDKGGEVAQSLDRVYSYLINRLLEANINSDAGAISEVIKHLRILMNAWKKVAEPKAAAQPVRKAVTPAAVPVSRAGSEYKQRSAIELVG